MSIPQIAPYSLPVPFPPSRADWRLEPSRMAILVHDLQDHFLAYFDRQAEPIRTLLENVSKIITHARTEGVPIIYSAQPGDQSLTERGLLSEMWGPGITGNPEGVAIAVEVKPEPGDRKLRKFRYSAFRGTDLLETLRSERRDQLLIVGVYAHIGCLASALDAFMFDVKPWLVADALGDFSAEYHRQALAIASNAFSVITNTDQVLERIRYRGGSAPTYEAFRAELAALMELPCDTLVDDASLLDHGLDSIRIMELVEKFRAWGVETSFMELADRPTVASYWAILANAGPATRV
jgi:bifunctional isochorismate lyase / aryl carrier protein